MRSMEHYIQELASHEAFVRLPPSARARIFRLAGLLGLFVHPLNATDALALWALLDGPAAVAVRARAAPPSASLQGGPGVVGMFSLRVRVREPHAAALFGAARS